MVLSDLEENVKRISRETLELLEKTNTPALPCYYSKAFADLVKKCDKEIAEEISKRAEQLEILTVNKSLEESIYFAHSSLREYSETTIKLREIMSSQGATLDLATLESDQLVPVSIVDELRAQYIGLTSEIKKAESTILKLENDLEKIEMNSFVDPLTRLRTSTFLRRHLEQILEAGHNRNLDLWIAMFTIDNYEQLKDHFGYVVMEKVLLFMAKSLQATIRSDNRIYRYDEKKQGYESIFCVVFNRMDKQGAYVASGRVRSRVEASKLVYADQVVNVTISAAIVPHRAADTVDLLCRRAENTLDLLPKLGTNAIHVIED
ncbi:MAG: GGDEF domain-containing protein [Helicobacteraceae bacterium]|jgi:diguanylate cyclase (GGDEF)-like protein|nr:GGDEF domain-containing protein [Helicobacteraceae bacterium]